jgi:hypothetical protein
MSGISRLGQRHMGAGAAGSPANAMLAGPQLTNHPVRR